MYKVQLWGLTNGHHGSSFLHKTVIHASPSSSDLLFTGGIPCRISDPGVFLSWAINKRELFLWMLFFSVQQHVKSSIIDKVKTFRSAMWSWAFVASESMRPISISSAVTFNLSEISGRNTCHSNIIQITWPMLETFSPHLCLRQQADKISHKKSPRI